MIRFVGYVDGGVAHAVEVVSGLPELLATLDKRGVRFIVTTDRDKAIGWCDDERSVCYLCSDGRGEHACASCQEVMLLGRLSLAMMRREGSDR